MKYTGINAVETWYIRRPSVYDAEGYKLCVYCGDRSTQIDHVYPRSRMIRLVEKFVSEKVDSCQECNLLLGAANLMTVQEKKDYLVARVENRHWRILNLPIWTEEELRGLTNHLETKIRAEQAMRQHLESRISTLLEPDAYHLEKKSR